MPRRIFICAAGLLLFALPLEAAPVGPDAPHISLELEGQLVQPNSSGPRGGGLGIWAAFRFTDQLALTAAINTIGTASGPFASGGAGIRATLDLLPLTPFIDVQLIALGPSNVSGYSVATRIGGGVDYQLKPGYAIGLAVRALTPIDDNPRSSEGIEISFRLVLLPALIN